MNQLVTSGNSDRLPSDRFGAALARQRPGVRPKTARRELAERRTAVKEWAIAMAFAAVFVAIVIAVKFVLFLGSPAGGIWR